jgi:hypothetical protein
MLDAIAARAPFRLDAEKIILMAAEDKVEGFISAKSAADIYYVARKHLSEKIVREALRNLHGHPSCLPRYIPQHHAR